MNRVLLNKIRILQQKIYYEYKNYQITTKFPFF